MSDIPIKSTHHSIRSDFNTRADPVQKKGHSLNKTIPKLPKDTGAFPEKIVKKTAHAPKIQRTASLKIAPESTLRKPIELWEVFPPINLIEIKQKSDLKMLKTELASRMNEVKHVQSIEPLIEYDLSAFGINKSIQVIGNLYIPLKRSEHREIQSALAKISPELGLHDPNALTFIIIDDHLWEPVLQELHQHAHLMEATIKESKHVETKSKKVSAHTLKNIPEPSTPHIHTQKNKWRAELEKVFLQHISDQLHSVQKRKKHNEEEAEAIEKCIQFSLLQFERLQKEVINQSNKKELTQKDLETLIHKWETSCPPFPIRPIQNSVLWRELKSQMIEKLLATLDF